MKTRPTFEEFRNFKIES